MTGKLINSDSSNFSSQLGNYLVYSTPNYTGLPVKNERGGILPFVSIIAVVLILFAGLAIDTSFLSVSKFDQDSDAGKAALAALHAWKTSSLPTESDKMDLAQNRVASILEKNYSISESRQQSFSKTVGDTPTDFASVSFGDWFFEDPGCGDATQTFDTTASCPCPLGVWKRPCFLETSAAEVANQNKTVNAYRVNLSTPQGNPIKNFFGSVAGQADVYLSSEATAASYSKNIIFLIDLSRSSFEDTHFSQPKIQPSVTGYPGVHLSNYLAGYDETEAANNIFYASEYNFRCNEGVYTDCNKHINDGMPTWGCENPASCQMLGGSGLANTIWNSYMASSMAGAPVGHGDTRAMGPATLRVNPLKHFKDDYAGLPLADPSNYGFHYVDAHCQASDQPGIIEGYMDDCPVEYLGPEPLSSVLAGVRHALDLLQPVDGVGVIGFDSAADNYHRRFHGGVSLPTDINDPLSAIPPFVPEPATDISSISPIMQRLREVMDVEARDGDFFLKRVQKHHFLNLDDDNLDIPEALSEALGVLQSAPNFDISENIVVLISDGITNCVGGTCGNDYQSYQDSMAAAEQIIDDNYIPAGVKFHFINVGELAGAHQILRRGVDPVSDTCLEPGPFSENVQLVNPCASCLDTDSCGTCTDGQANWDNFQIGQEKFYEANRLYVKAVETGGTYRAVLPACDPSLIGGGISLAQCRAGSFEDSLENLCEAAPSPGDVVTVPQFTDDSGRMLCEPGCRTKSEQIKNQMEKIFDSPGFFLVQ